MFDIAEELKKLPHQSGVYIMKDGDTILYVGKAVNLYNRVHQYFQNPKGKTPKILKMISRIKEFEYIITSSETEALILENNLIKRYRPPYNTMLKDDKQYPYIKATVQEAFPRIFSTRTVKKDGARYFGPYTNAGAVHQTLEVLSQIFTLRSCNRKLPEEIGKGRPCLNYDMHRCLGPCSGHVSQEDYALTVKNAIDFLDGKQKAVLDNLKKEMMAASDDLNFERAAILRDQIISIKALQEKQIIENANSSDESDVIAFAKGNLEALVQAFFIRNGKLIGREHYFLNIGSKETGDEIIRAFITQFYSGTAYIPSSLLVVEEPDDREALENWLSEKAGHKVHIRKPQRGEKLRMVEMAKSNAEMTLHKLGNHMAQEERRTRGAMNKLFELLGIERDPEAAVEGEILEDEEVLMSESKAGDENEQNYQPETDETPKAAVEHVPTRIEAYDISNTFGFLSVGSMVVFEDGRPLKNDYRKFRIQTVYGANDYASLQEVLRRRFSHAIREIKEMSEEGKDLSLGKFTRLPDLILMDGGKGQVHIAEEVLQEFGLDIPVAGMVKDDTHSTRGLYYHQVELPIDPHSDEFHLITRIQDEAHRFAITYHKNIRAQEQVQSVLDEIPGIGPARRKKLLAAFGSVDTIRQKTPEELAQVDGMNAKAAEAVYLCFHQ